MTRGDEWFSSLLWRTSLAGSLLGTAGTLYFLAGLGGYLLNPALNLSLAFVALTGLIFFFGEFFRAVSESSPAGRALWSGSLLLLVATLLLCALPPTARDELTHHLNIPRLYVRAGRIIQVPMAPYSYYPMLLDMFFTPWVVWGYDSVPKVIHALFGFLTGLLLYAYLARRINAVYGLLGFFAWISIPCIFRLSQWAYVDLGLVFYTTSALLCLLRWDEGRQDRAWLGIAGLAAGFAFATKPNGLIAVLLLFAIFAWRLARSPNSKRGTILAELAMFSAAIALPCLPWLVKNYYQTGNPFFPLLGSFFSAHGAAASAPALYVPLGVFDKRELLYSESLFQIIALPFRLFFFGEDDNPQYFDGVLSPMLVLFLPWALSNRWRGEKLCFLAFATLFLFYAIFSVDLRARYVLPIVPPLIVLFTYAVFNIQTRIDYPPLLYGFVFLLASYHGYYAYRYFQAAVPLAYLRGHESRAVYLERALPDYTTFQFINHQLPTSAKIYLLFVGRRGYYCERDYFHDAGELPALLQASIASASKPVQIEQTLKRFGITHLMVRTDLLARYLVENLSPAQIALWNEFAQNRLSLNFHDRGYALYRLDA
jgi:4-amino-4-deoxy-L-arabinose transferase-like glycosyltransferase